MLATTAEAQQLSFDGEAVQGGLVIGRVDDPTARITVDGKDVRRSPAGEFLIGFARDAGPRTVVAAILPAGNKATKTLTVKKRTYKIDRIDGLPQAQVSPDPEAMKRIQADTAEIAKARAADTAQAFFAAGFAWPATGRISGVYGSQRILNGEPRSPHYGVDIAAPRGTPIRTMGDGVVAVAHPDMFLTGRTVMIDHGHGLTSVYAHMDEIRVTPGQRVAKGDVIGLLGASGRVTGPHLHWGAALFSTQLDPALLAGPMGEDRGG